MKKLIAMVMLLCMALTLSSCLSAVYKLSQKEQEVTRTTEDVILENEPETIETVEPTEAGTEGEDHHCTGSSTPLLYKATDTDGSVVWLMGTIHAGKESFYPFPEYVMDAYDSADALAVECDIMAAEEDIELLTMCAKSMMYTDGSTISDHVDADLYEKAKELLRDKGTYNFSFDYFMPIFWSQLLDELIYEEAGIDYDLGVDRYFLELAKEEGKEIQEVESVLFQYQMLSNFSEELQICMLEGSCELTAEEVSEELGAMMDIWAKGDEDDMIDMVNASDDVPPEEQELYHEYNNAMIVERNIGMADFAQDALEENEEVFICVGMAHVVGEGGMVDLLRSRGYNVEIVR